MPRSPDTSAAAEAAQFEAYRRMTPAQRVAIAIEMSEAARATTLAAIRARHPDYDPEMAKWALFRILHGDEVFRRVWPGAPLIAP